MAVPRLKRRAEFLAVSAQRNMFRTPTLLVQIRERPEEELPSVPVRVGFTASRRVGIAVVRNRAKRRLRALVDHEVPRFRWRSSIDMVLIATSSTAVVSFSSIVHDFYLALTHFHLVETL